MILGAALYVGRAIEDHWFWRSNEYTKLDRLRAGFNLEYFERLLGPPIVTRNVSGFAEKAFRGRGYWVKTISRGKTVDLYSVTACDTSFAPTIGFGSNLTLNRTTLADISRQPQELIHDYRVGVTAPTFLFEGAYTGFSGYYKVVFWGFNGICPQTSDPSWFSFLPRKRSGSTKTSAGALASRKKVVINTYGETAPLMLAHAKDFFGIRSEKFQLTRYHHFYTAVDRVLTQGG